jgi:hypothetical protein
MQRYAGVTEYESEYQGLALLLIEVLQRLTAKRFEFNEYAEIFGIERSDSTKQKFGGMSPSFREPSTKRAAYDKEKRER